MRRRKLIMVVDDCQGILDTIETLLGDSYEVVVAEDAWQAFKILQTKKPDLIFLDCMMPGFTGLQLLREIRQMKIDSRVEVITASILSEIEEEVDHLGVDNFVHKPFDVHQILDLAARFAA